MILQQFNTFIFFRALQDKYCFWTEFLLLVHNILLLVFAFNALGDPSLNLLVITLTSLSLTVLFGVFHQVYKKRYCNILEFSFYLNLGAVSVATLYTHATNGKQAAVIYCFLHICRNSVVPCVPSCKLSSQSIRHVAESM